MSHWFYARISEAKDRGQNANLLQGPSPLRFFARVFVRVIVRVIAPRWLRGAITRVHLQIDGRVIVRKIAPRDPRGKETG
jgi:hypothetical protein